MSSTFIIGCSRSATTALLKAFALSKEAFCALEPMSNLNIESRDLLENRISDPFPILAKEVAPRIAQGLLEKPHYIEKQVSNFMPFIKPLHDMFKCKFIIPIRDGREVVTSLINWHNQMFPIIYQECKYPGNLSEQAKQVIAHQQGPDPFDYSLPRPQTDDPSFHLWENFSQFEMMSWHWNYVNLYIIEQLKLLDPSCYRVVDTSKLTVEKMRELYEFIGLTDFDETKIASLLEAKINSLEERINDTGVFPKHTYWSAEQMQTFRDLASDAMVALGYYDSEQLLKRRPIKAKFKPYTVVTAFNQSSDITNLVSANVEHFGKMYPERINSLAMFEELILKIKSCNNLKLGSVADLALTNHCNVALRVDVDIDIITAYKMAVIANKHAAPISFYILHTAGYYGLLLDDVFYRNDCYAAIYKGMQSLGAEIGIHIDPLHFYMNHNIDGSQALLTELAWLRKQGLKISGYTAHGVAAVYQAENFEIFSEKVIKDLNHLERSSQKYPLGILSQAACHLNYEGAEGTRPKENFSEKSIRTPVPENLLLDEAWMKDYLLTSSYCQWGYNYHLWLVSGDCWVFAGKNNDGKEIYEFNLSTKKALKLLESIPQEEKLLITLHPIYFSKSNAYSNKIKLLDKASSAKGIIKFKHLHDVNENYKTHFLFAIKSGVMSITAGICLIVHAFFPPIFLTTGSTLIKRITDRFQHRTRKNNLPSSF